MTPKNTSCLLVLSQEVVYSLSSIRLINKYGTETGLSSLGHVDLSGSCLSLPFHTPWHDNIKRNDRFIFKSLSGFQLSPVSLLIEKATLEINSKKLSNVDLWLP